MNCSHLSLFKLKCDTRQILPEGPGGKRNEFKGKEEGEHPPPNRHTQDKYWFKIFIFILQKWRTMLSLLFKHHTHINRGQRSGQMLALNEECVCAKTHTHTLLLCSLFAFRVKNKYQDLSICSFVFFFISHSCNYGNTVLNSFCKSLKTTTTTTTTMLKNRRGECETGNVSPC